MHAIVCIRHLASVYGFNDAMWTKYKLAESQKVLENGAPATQNAFAKAANDLSARGVIVAGVIVTNRAQEKGFAYTYVG